MIHSDIRSGTVSGGTRSPPGFSLPPFPPSLRRVIARLPQYPPSAIAALILNLWLREILCGEELREAHGKVICIEVQDVGVRLLFELHREGVAACTGKSPDLVITADTEAFYTLARRSVDADTLFFSRRLVMMGDTDLGLLLRNTVDATDAQRTRPRLPSPLSVLKALRNAVLPSA
jgi:O2-independent ubiquinone biosynthesis accessory factor UbiT